MSFDPAKITVFAKTDARGQNTSFGIKALDRSRHMYVIGKTGMGKSTLLENMAVQDIANGEGMAFIDPHGATAETLLDYIPEERKDDVLYFAPFDTQNPVAFNVMEDVGPDKRHLVVSGLMSVFKKIWLDAWSARMEYILQNTLLALLEYPDSTLLGVNRMLSEKNYRKKVIDNITDPAVKAFWVDEFLNYNERYMQEAGDAIKNKIGQFTANPLIRNIIGQPKSSFDIRKMMDEKKIIIMNLSKGLVGESNANLLGSMLTTRLYLAAMSRADLSQSEMREAPQFYFYVDEFQSFANATFADILSEARKYKLNLTIAHQYIEQMEEEVRNAVFGNVGTIVSFRVGPFDAEILETIFAPKFYAVDICNLGFAQIYLTLMIDGIGSAPFSAVTLPPIEQKATSCKDMVIHASRQQFARPREEVENEIMTWMDPSHGAPKAGSAAEKKSMNKPAARLPRRPAEGDKPKTENSGPSRRDDRPPRRDEGRRTAPKNEKSLDDLRSVLAGMSTKSADHATKKTVSKADEVTKGSGQDEKKTPAPTVAQKTTPVPAAEKVLEKSREVDVKKTERRDVPPRRELDQKRDSRSAEAFAAKQAPSEEKKSDTAEDLKVMLAKMLEKQTANISEVRKDKKVTSEVVEESSKKVEHNDGRDRESRRNESPESHNRTDQLDTGSRRSDKSKKRLVPKEQSQSSVRQEFQTERDTVLPPQLEADAKQSDPFDPKVLERMMRVKTGDKTPLK